MQSALLSAPNHKAAGDLREAISDSYFANSNYTKLDGKCGAQCFDGVYLKHGELYIVEVKPWKENGAIQLTPRNRNTLLPRQMSDKWINDRVNHLLAHGTPEAKETARLIHEAIEKKRPINKVVIGIRHDSAVTVNLGNKVEKIDGSIR